MFFQVLYTLKHFERVVIALRIVPYSNSGNRRKLHALPNPDFANTSRSSFPDLPQKLKTASNQVPCSVCLRQLHSEGHDLRGPSQTLSTKRKFRAPCPTSYLLYRTSGIPDLCFSTR